jgi:hypothetical protein
MSGELKILKESLKQLDEKMQISPKVTEGVDYEPVYAKGTVEIFRILTQLGMTTFGEHTDWPMAKRDNVFDIYDRDGYTFYILINTGTARKDEMHRVVIGVKNNKLEMYNRNDLPIKELDVNGESIHSVIKKLK